jgi:ABC-type multidrug transport system fused ATPase/permease subunit
MPTQKIKNLMLLFADKKKTALVVVLLSLISTSVDCLNVVLIIPIVQFIINPEKIDKYAEYLNIDTNTINLNYALPLLCLLFILLIILKSLIGLLRIYTSRKLVWQLRRSWLNAIFNKYINSEISYVLKRKKGELVHNLIVETRRAAICLSQMVEYFSQIILTTALYFIMLSFAPEMTLLVSLFGILSIFIISKLKKHAAKFAAQRQKLLKDISETSVEGLSTIREIKSLGIEALFKNRFRDKTAELADVEVKFETMRNLPARINEIIVAFAMTSVLIYTYSSSQSALITALPVLSLLAVVGTRLMKNLSTISSMYLQIIGLIPSLKVIQHLVNPQNESGNTENNRSASIQKISSIKLNNISFNHENKQTAIDNFSMEIKKGEVTILNGPSGSGKTTVADLIMRFYSPDTGTITIDGKPISSIPVNLWRKKIAYVSQTPFLFNLSISDNIAAAAPDCTEKEITDAAKKAHIHDIITKFPKSYNTNTGDLGQTLSGGERQRIAVARALIADPDLFIFDEPTSALDPESEKQIISVIKELAQNKMVLLITHRSELIKEKSKRYNIGLESSLSGDQ